jgi:very-short-patch-repair endonuclease
LSGSAKPWAEARVATQEEATRARDLLHELRGQLLPRANKAFERCCQESGIPGPATISERGGHLSIWNEVAVHMEDATPEIYDTDLASLARDLEKARDGGLGRITASLFSGTYKRARDTAKGLLRVEVDDARALSLIEASDSQVDRWQGLGGRGRPNAPAHLHDAVLSHDALVNGLVELGDVLSRDDLVSMPPEGLSGVLVALEADEATLAILPELHRLHSELSEAGLGDLRDLLVERRVDADGARDAFRFAWLTSVLDEIRFTDPRVGTFSPENLDRSLATFQASDRSHIQTTAERVRRRYAERVTAARDANPTESALLQREANKRRGHLPLRKLVERAPKVLVSLKPCWAVSPLLVSQVLPADMRFDVVVFDEASQVSPADAVTSIMRGDRTVVAGDDRQLPPTAFFTSTTAEDELDDEGGIVDATQGFESILDVASAYIPFRMLGWHYRSLDERLISFSNAHVYDGGLTTFPGIGGEAPIRHELVDHGAPTGGADSSVHEVNRVVELVIAHAEERPSESLGVIALGIKHAERIEEALRLALTMRRDLDDFFDEDREERFFVKNLERVQGDEREAIILSIGYAKGQDGRLRHQFGPINLEGGERRLNVAVTRARRRMTLVSSFSASDIDPNRSSSRGVALLRQYLQFADSRGDYLGDHAPEHPPLNPFEIDVRDTLAAEGIPLTPQLGASGYFIDFAAGHPDRPGDFVLAIECDGASYHSAPTARDRDRLRQQQLERLGWRFHRIWSTDWFNEKRAATERAVRAWRHAAEATDDERRGASPVPPPVSPSGGGDAGARDDNGLGADSAPIPEQGGALRIAADEQLHLSDSATSAPQRASRDGGCPIPPGQPITAYSQSQLRALVRWIKSDTRLRTREELLDEAMRALGFRRRGARIVEALNKAIVAEDRAPSGKQ